MKMRESKGFTLIELLIVVAIIGIIAAIAIPGLLRARMSGNEASAIGSLRAINSGQAAYSSSCGNGGYATTLGDLFEPPATAGATGFISPDLRGPATQNKSGYAVVLAPGEDAVAVADGADTCNGTDSQSSYYGSATPLTHNGTGTRSFATDVRGTIFQNNTDTAPSATDILASTATPVQ